MNSARDRTLSWRDMIVASVMAALGASGGWQIMRQARGSRAGSGNGWSRGRRRMWLFDPAAEQAGFALRRGEQAR